jgi:thymidylate kinase
VAEPTPIFVITGQLSAGKSTIARALMDRFEHGVYVDVDGIRELVTSGLAGPLEWTDETTRQFGLAIRASVALAQVYADADFAVAIEGGMDPELVEAALEAAGLADRSVLVVLHPRLDIALDRNRSRTSKPFDTAILEDAMRSIETDLARDSARPRWHRVDNSDESVADTVDRILAIRR